MISKTASGLSSYIIELVPRLCNAGHRVTVVAADCGYAGAEAGELPVLDNRVVLKLFPVRRAWDRRLYRCRDLVEWVRSSLSTFDVVDIQGIWTWIAADVAEACSDARIPYVLTPHGMMARNDWGKRPILKRWFFTAKFQSVWKNADAVRYLSEGELESSMLAPVRRHAVVPNAIEVPREWNMEAAAAQAKCRFGLKPDDQVLLFLGRISPEKGVVELLRAFEEVQSNHPRSRLLLAGPLQGRYARDVQAQLARRPDLRVSLLGPVFGELKYGLLAAASVFVTLSKSEGMAIAALEALSVGVPVVLTREANFPQAEIGGAGITTSFDPSIAANDISKLLAEPDRLAQMRHNTRTVVQANFSWEVVLPHLLKLYQDVAAC